MTFDSGHAKTVREGCCSILKVYGACMVLEIEIALSATSVSASEKLPRCITKGVSDPRLHQHNRKSLNEMGAAC